MHAMLTNRTDATEEILNSTTTKNLIVSSKSRISSLLTTLSAQLDLIKANYAARQQQLKQQNPTATTTATSTTLRSLLVNSTRTILLELDEEHGRRQHLATTNFNNDSIRIIDYIANSLVPANNSQQNDAPMIATVLSSPCLCNNTLPHLPDKFLSTASANYEINNIWKLAFFILAFFIGFVSLLLILVFSIKIIVAKLNKRRILKYEIGNFYLPSSHVESDVGSKSYHHPHQKSDSTIATPIVAANSSLSILDFDPDLLSSKKQSSQNIKTPITGVVGDDGKKVAGRRAISTTSMSLSPSSLSPSSAKSRGGGSGGGIGKYGKNHNHHQKHKHHQKNSTGSSRSTSLTSSGAASQTHQSQNHLFSKESNYITEEELLDCQKRQKQQQMQQQKQQQACYIYGITNRGFLDDSQLSITGGGTNNTSALFYNSSPSHHAAFTGNSPVTTICVVPSSFRPLPKTTPPKVPSTSNETNEMSPPLPQQPSNEASAVVDTTKVAANVAMTTTTANKAIASIEDQMEINKKLMSVDHINTYQIPWKPPNDYEALENNTVTGSLANLSSVTTFSEIYSEAKANAPTTLMTPNTDNHHPNQHHRHQHHSAAQRSSSSSSGIDKSSSSPSSSSYTCTSSSPECSSDDKLAGTCAAVTTASSREFILTCSNTNEHISRSAKITQELEARLKERRQLMESKSDKFQPKLLHENEFTSINQAISLSHLENRLQNWSNSSMEKTPNIQPSLIKAAVMATNSASCNSSNSSSASTSTSCICPCHMNSMTEKCTAHKTLPAKTGLDATGVERGSKKNGSNGPTTTTIAATAPTATTNNYKNSRKPKIIIDGSSTLPTKRESIRMLIENKAVTENKQKNALEMHLNTLICTRKTTNSASNRVNA